MYILANLTDWSVPTWLIVLAVLFVCYQISRRRNLRNRMTAKIQSVFEEISKLNGKAAELMAHMFLDDGWDKVLVGQSKETLIRIRDRKSEVFQSLEALKLRHQEASSKRRRLTRSSALTETFRLLSVSPIRIAEKDWTPANLMTQIDKWLDELVADLDSLATALRTSRVERQALDADVSELDARLTALEQEGLRCAALSRRFTALKRVRKEELDGVIVDPLSMAPQVVELRSQMSAMSAELEQIASDKAEFDAESAEQLTAMERLAKQAATTKIVYGFPLAAGEQAPWQERNLPAEDIEAARAAGIARQKALSALGEGDVTAFKRESAHFRRLSRATLDHFQQLVECKEKVDQLAPLTRRSLDNLRSGLPGADSALARLETEFNPADFAEAQARLAAATSINDRAEASWSTLKSHYDQGRFGDAQKLCEQLSVELTGAEDNIAGLDCFSEEIRQTREQVETQLERCRSQFDSALAKLALARSALSARTLAKSDEIELLWQDAAGDKPAWKSLEKRCRELPKLIKQLASAIDQDKEAQQKAHDKLQAAQDAVTEATRAADRPSTRRIGRTKLQEATGLLEVLNEDIEVDGSDWAELEKRAAEILPLAREATRRGNYDEEKFLAGKEAIASAEGKQKRLGAYATGNKATIKMLAANRSLDEARLALNDRRWEDAEKLASQAEQSYQGSLNARGM